MAEINKILLRNVRKYTNVNKEAGVQELSQLFLVSEKEIEEVLAHIKQTSIEVQETAASDYTVTKLKKESNKNFLKDLALDRVTYEEAVEAHAKNATIDKLKLFQLQLAKSEMLRVTRLLDTFSILQDKYIEEVENNAHIMDLTELVEQNQVIFKFMQQSLSIIDKFTKDETLQLLILDHSIDKESENIRTVYTGEEIIADKFARREVRKSAARIINSLTAITQPEEVLEGEIVVEETPKQAIKEVSKENPYKTASMTSDQFAKQLEQLPDDAPIGNLFNGGGK